MCARWVRFFKNGGELVTGLLTVRTGTIIGIHVLSFFDGSHISGLGIKRSVPSRVLCKGLPIRSLRGILDSLGLGLTLGPHLAEFAVHFLGGIRVQGFGCMTQGCRVQR